jgi:1,4-dihydroxy-2-naphthoyl-CoA hydrolase
MSIWKRDRDLDYLNTSFANSMVGACGIVLTKVSDDTLEGVMPVDATTRQPYGVLHGGASCVLIETLGSIASYLCVEDDETILGTEINASHLKAVPEDQEVRGVCKPLRIGRTQHVWDIRLYNPNNDLCCAGRLTVKVIKV